MSDCRKFGVTDANLSPEDRLAELERKFSSIIERIKSYDSVLNQFSAITKKLEKIEQQHEGLQSADLRYADENKAAMLHVSSKIDALARSFQDHQKQIFGLFDELKNAQQNLATQHYILKDSSARFERRISEASENFASKDELAAIKNYYEASLKSIKADIDRWSSVANGASQSISELQTLQKQHQVRIESVAMQVRGFEHDMNAREANLKHSIRELSNSINCFASKRDLEESSKSIKAEITGTPSALESMKTELLKRFEISTLDASNSVLKANNCVKQIELMERKIENLALLVKKYELSK